MFTSSKHTDTPYPTDTPTPSPSVPGSHAGTIIARGVKVEGAFNSQGDVVIEGEVQGSISAAGTLTVGPEAHIKADIAADEAVISGRVDGNVTVKKQAVLHASANVKGDITAERITIQSGAALEGRVQIGSPTMTSSTKAEEQKVEGKKDEKASDASSPQVDSASVVT